MGCFLMLRKNTVRGVHGSRRSGKAEDPGVAGKAAVFPSGCVVAMVAVLEQPAESRKDLESASSERKKPGIRFPGSGGSAVITGR